VSFMKTVRRAKSYPHEEGRASLLRSGVMYLTEIYLIHNSTWLR
jgi:hypothetical protein